MSKPTDDTTRRDFLKVAATAVPAAAVTAIAPEAVKAEAVAEGHGDDADRELATTPLLVIANKIDLDPHISEPDLIRELNLDYITENPWIVIPVSALKVINIDQVLSWLIKQGSANK